MTLVSIFFHLGLYGIDGICRYVGRVISVIFSIYEPYDEYCHPIYAYAGPF